jgi:hypothetical protein
MPVGVSLTEGVVYVGAESLAQRAPVSRNVGRNCLGSGLFPL